MTIKVAIIGAGAFAREHVAALSRIPEIKISRIADRDRERASSLAALVPGAGWTTDLDAALSDPAIDAVDICVATPAHAALTIAAAQYGKHIHVEKPAALSLADFDAMVEAVRQHQTTLMVGQTARFQPVHWQLHESIASGAIGRLRYLHVQWYAGYRWPQGWRAWQLDPVLSGGHPVHNGVHAIDLAVWLFGKAPVKVFARSLQTWAASMPVPDSFHLTLKFEDGSLALLEQCYALQNKGDYLRRVLATGEQGTLRQDTGREAGLTANGVYPPSPAVEDALYRQLSHWCACLQGKEAPVVTLAQVRQTLQAALAAQQSLETGRAIALTEEI